MTQTLVAMGWKHRMTMPAGSSRWGPSRAKGSPKSPRMNALIWDASSGGRAFAAEPVFGRALEPVRPGALTVESLGFFSRPAMTAFSRWRQRIQDGAQAGDRNSKPGWPVCGLVADLIEGLLEDKHLKQTVGLCAIGRAARAIPNRV